MSFFTPKLNEKLEAIRAILDEEGTPQYTHVIKPSGTAKAIPTAAVKAGKTPEYGDEGEEMETDEPGGEKETTLGSKGNTTPQYTKVQKASGSAKAIPTPTQSKPPSSKPGGLAGESLDFFRRMSGVRKP